VQAWALNGVRVQQFMASHRGKCAPHELVLDADATHVPLHGERRARLHPRLPRQLLLSPAADNIRGAAINVDGGWVAQ